MELAKEEVSINLNLSKLETGALVKVLDDAVKFKGLENSDFCSHLHKKIVKAVKDLSELPKLPETHL